MDKNGITIANYQKGTANSPFIGFGKMINADIFSAVGALKCNNKLVASGNTISGIPTAQCFYNGEIFTGTSLGNVYRNNTLIASSRPAIQDMVVYKDYLVISTAIDATVTAGGIDTYGPLSVSPGYNNNVLNLANKPSYGFRKLVLNSTDPVNGVWVGNEGYIASISSAFTGIADSGFNATKFTLPNGRVVTTACEYGDDLAIMTKVQNGSDFASIVFWDKAATYGSTIHLSETTSNQMLSANNRLYYVGNDTGTLFEANKSSFIKIWTIPDRQSWQTFSNYQNAMCVLQNQILFGYAPGFNSYPDKVYYGIYAYQPGLGVSIKNTISTGNYGLNQSLSITTLIGRNQNAYYAGWIDGSSTGQDAIDVSQYAITTIESELYQVGTFFASKTYSKAELNLGENLPTGSSITLAYRKTISDSWSTPVRTISPASSGGVARYETSFATDDLTTVQFQIILNPGTSNLTTPTLLGVYLQ